MKNPYDSQWLLRYERRREHEDNSQTRSPVTQPPVCHEPMETKAREENHTGRVSVRVVSYRRRLCDADNLCPKYFVDCLRYAGIIKDDSAKHITLSVSQEKVKTKADERTEIEIL